MKQASFHLRTLGPVTLTRADGTEVTTVLSQPKRLALLVYLAVANRGAMCRRDTVLGVFWPEFDQERARAALRKALHFLRTELGDGVIIARGDNEIGVDAKLLSWDVHDFEAALETNGPETALDAYVGDFLDGFYIADAPDFEHWTELARRQLKNSAADAAQRLAQRALDAQDSRTAVRWARAWVRLAPIDEAAARALMAALGHAGERAEALAAYGELTARLRDLQLEPSPETQLLADSIRDRQADSHAPPATPRTPERLVSTNSRSRPLMAVVVGAAIAAAAYGVARLTSGRTDDGSSVAVREFTNLTGDSTLASVGAVYQRAIADGLAQIQRVSVLAFGDSTAPMLTVSGSYHRVGDSLEIATEIVDHERGRTLPAPLPIRVPIEDPAVRTDELRRSLMGAIGYYTDLWNPSDPVRRPPNWEAYTTFQTGLYTTIRGWGNPSILRLADSIYRRVIELDPSYTEAYLWLGGVMSSQRGSARERAAYPQLGNYAAMDSLTESLRAHVNPFTELDRAVAGFMGTLAQGDYRAMLRWGLEIDERLPTRPSVFIHLPAVIGNRPQPATDEMWLMIHDDWYFDWWLPWWWLLGNLHLGEEYEDEAAAIAVAATRRIDTDFYELRARAALGDVGRVRELTGNLIYSLAHQGGFEVRAHALDRSDDRMLAESDRLLRWAMQWYDDAPNEWYRKVNASWILPMYDRTEEVVANLEAMVRDSAHLVDLKGMLGVAYAKQGNREAAEAIDVELANVDPTGLRGLHTLWRARIAAQSGRKDDAVRLLDQALREGTWFQPAFPAWGSYWHSDPDFEPLRGHPPYERLVAPKQ